MEAPRISQGDACKLDIAVPRTLDLAIELGVNLAGFPRVLFTEGQDAIFKIDDEQFVERLADRGKTTSLSKTATKTSYPLLA
ncbi:hypothetical protein TBK1r_01740 [Stieleria magnilauensis]|uniref:Uncharacterized protein n=1 Tax=Stieleria magnilauensis TaxID=2527963 RepID=A0ABX5XHB0_9BACT|nr:hypothetical protein TBK1r_01740 [Planctomycetes bacterium TBK1r]